MKHMSRYDKFVNSYNKLMFKSLQRDQQSLESDEVMQQGRDNTLG